MMKKITLLLIALMCFTFGQSQSLPFDFEASQPFIGDSGAAVSDIDDGSVWHCGNEYRFCVF